MGATDDRPNVLMILTDQERYEPSSPAGLPDGMPAVDTANIDRLREEGMHFSNAYTPIGICSSARASLMTGLYPHEHGMMNNCHEPDALQDNLPDRYPTFSELLQQNGYRLSYAGKWHVGADQTPEDFGFTYLGGGDGGHSSTDPALRQYQRDQGVDPDNIPLEDTITTNLQDDDATLVAATMDIPKEATRTYYLAERTIEQLRNYEQADTTFFHRIDFPGPHHPYMVPEPYASRYDPDEIAPWENFADTFEDKPAVQEKSLHYRGVASFDWDTWSEAVAKYFGRIDFIDDQIGRILDELDELGLAEDTVVVHAADHGDMTGSHRQFNKGQMMYEEVYHIPLQVRWPETVDAGTVCDEYVTLMDLMPTFLDVTDTAIPEDLHGRSIAPLLRGGGDDWQDSIYMQYHGEEFGLGTQRGVIKDGYKFIYNKDGVDELYDLNDDPHELHNRVEDPDLAEKRNELVRELIGWMDETDDPHRLWPTKYLRNFYLDTTDVAADQPEPVEVEQPQTQDTPQD